MTTNHANEAPKEDALLSIFYKRKERDKKPVYDITDNEEMLNIAINLKEKRKTSVEGVLYLSSQENANPDYILTGEQDLVKKEKEKYLKYLIEKHKKWLPSELLREKLQRRIRRLQTIKMKPSKDEKREKRADGKQQDKDDLNYRESPREGDEGIEEFEDLEDLEEDYGLFEDDEGFDRESNMMGAEEGEY